jgi:biopolymer transport protein ExbD
MLPRLAARRRRPVADEAIHIVALWNLMIILIPFLLLSAVFSQTSILNLYLPPPQDAPAPSRAPADHVPKPVVSILSDGYVLSDGPQVIAAIPLDEQGGYNTRKLTELLVEIKRSIPAQQDIVILSQADTSYDLLVQTMDASREWVAQESGRPVAQPLFPNISLGRVGGAAPAPLRNKP